MTQKSSLRNPILKSICIILITVSAMLFSQQAEASHFRGGTLSWSQTGGNDITFTVNTVWTNFSGTPVGGTVFLGDMNFGDGTVINMFATVTGRDVANNLMFFSWVYTYTYAGPGNYEASALNSCCRISTLQDGNNDDDFRLRSTVNVGGQFNNPPVASLPQLVKLPIGVTNASFTIPAVDPDGDNVTHRVSTLTESGLSTAQPAGFSLSSSGVAIMDTSTRTVGQLFSIQFMVEDALSKVPVDIIIEMIGATSSVPPVFVGPTPANNSVFFVTPPGDTVSFTIAANDPDTGQSTTLNSVALPIGATMTPALPVTSAVNGTASSTFSWTPDTSQIGEFVLNNFIAEDDTGLQTFTSVTIFVLCPLDVTVINATDPSCANSNDGSISVGISNASDPGNLIYSWTGPNSFTSSSQNLTGLEEGTYVLRVNDTATGCLGIETVTITGNPLPTGASSSETPICSGEAFSYNPSNNINDVSNGGNGMLSTFTWEVTSLSGGTLTGVTIGQTGTAAVAATADEILNNSATSGIIEYSVTPTSTPGGCEGDPYTITVTVNPLPTVTFTALADIAEDAGVQTGLGGGTPTGGVYSGPGVTDDSNGMTYSFDPAAAGVGVHTITYTSTDANGCTSSASDDVEILDTTGCGTIPSVMWTGAINSDWDNAGNWDNAPGLSVYADVTIPHSYLAIPNYPVLTAGQELYISECATVTIESGASLTVNPNSVVSNDGAVVNDGTSIFESDATGSAYIGSGTGMFIGDFMIERYIPAKRAYRQLSPPVTTSTPISENWQQDTHITGPAGNTDGFDVTQTGNPSMYIFDNSVYSYVQMANTNATNLIPGTMYHILVRGDRNTDLTNNNATPSVTTLRATGELTAENEGSKMISVNVPEQRFIAAGNPFQSQVDMNAVLTTNATNISPNFYWVWDPTLGARGAYTAVIASIGVASAVDSFANQYLQAGQAGWVQTAGAGNSSVSFTQASKYTGPETGVFRDASGLTSQGQLRLSLYESSALANNETAADGLLILFDTEGNNAVDNNDALNITNLDENFATNNNGLLLSIESRAAPEDEEEVQLEINTYRNTNYTIVAEGISMQGATAFLYDTFADVFVEIPQSGTVNYAYSIDTGDGASVAADRFKINFTTSTLSVPSLNMESMQLYPNPTSIGKFFLNIPTGMDDLEVTIYNAIGARLHYETGFTGGNNVNIDAVSKFSMGTYFVQLSSQGRTTTEKLIIN